MPNKRLPVRKIKEALRLKFVCGLGERKIAESCRIGHTTVANYLRRAEATGLRWEEAAELNEDEIEKRLFPELSEPTGTRPLPDCEHIYQEMRRYRNINLTLIQLWLEYKDHHPDGYQYTQFCDYYHRWRQTRLLCASGASGRRESIPRLLRWYTIR